MKATAGAIGDGKDMSTVEYIRTVHLLAWVK